MDTLKVVLFLIIYFLPTIIGWWKKKGHGITALNLFLGWTIIGWIGALIWALSAEKVK